MHALAMALGDVRVRGAAALGHKMLRCFFSDNPSMLRHGYGCVIYDGRCHFTCVILRAYMSPALSCFTNGPA